MRRFTRFTLGEQAAGLTAIRPHIDIIFDLLDDVTRRYAETKRRHRQRHGRCRIWLKRARKE